MVDHKKHKKINPIEILFFVLFLGIFLNSVYQLISHDKDPQFKALNTPSKSNKKTASSSQKTRDLASKGTSSELIQVDCTFSKKDLHKTKVDQIRLEGKLCKSKLNHLKKVSVYIKKTNQKKKVHTFQDSKNFSTEMIPLNQGSNQLFIYYLTKNNKKKEKELSVLLETQSVGNR